MSHSVQMPALGESVTEGTVTRWLKKEGDQVAEDEPLLEVSTDKVDTEVPAPYAGVLEKILVAEDETVEIGADLAIIGDGSGSVASAGAPAAESMTPPVAEPVPAEPVAPAPADETAAVVAEVEAAEGVAEVAADIAAPPAAAESAPASAGTEVTMPAMGESVTEGTITRWLKQVGDQIAEDEPIVEISTDKVDAEVPSPVAGTLLQILAAEDAVVEVGTPIALVGSASAAAPAAPAPAPAAESPAPAAAPVPATAPAAESPVPATAPAPAAPPAAAPTQAAPAGRSRGYITPVVRKLAADHGVDLAAVTGTGVGGRIRREDVLAAAETPAPAAPPVTVTSVPAHQPSSQPAPAAAPVLPPPAPATPVAPAPAVPAPPTAGTTGPAAQIRQAMARSMMYAATTAAQTTTIIEMDATRLMALLGRAQVSFTAREGIALGTLPFFIKAAIEAAKAHPIVNSSLSDDLSAITYHQTVNLGIPIETPRGLITPVIRSADDLNVTGLARRLADLADRTLGGSLTPDEVSGATFTVTSSGSSGTMIETPIVVPPQAAVLALGAISKRPVVVSDLEGNDVIAVRSIATVALSYDQRFVDGADAAHYLAAVKARIEAGDFEADLGL